MISTEKVKEWKASLKAQFTAKEPTDLVKQLIALHANRIDDGISRNLTESRAYKAIDLAYDVSQHQINPTLMRELIDKNPTSKDEALNLAKSWGLESMILPVDNIENLIPGRSSKGNKSKPGYLLQTPTFFQVYVPLLLSYSKMRWAKLWNDRDVHPLYKYEPLVTGIRDRAAAKVVTSRVSRMSAEMNYRATERDSIQKMLIYGRCINFPKECWYREKQKFGDKETIVKEGIRWELPHITRVAYDMTHPLYTLNSDTGVEWLFYWNLNRYGDIINNPDFWLPPGAKGKRGKNKEYKDQMLIPVGWRGDGAFTNLYQQFYPCTVKFPSVTSCATSTFANNRTNKAFAYNADTLDVGIDTAVFFHKLIPSKWGLYDYDYPVWHRFVYLGNSHVLHCEPIFYTPGVAYLYDYDAERARNSSLGFELMPFQDHMGNLLSQYLLTVKKNLIRIVGVNQDIVDKDDLAKIANNMENALRGFQFMPFSGQALKDIGTDISAAFQPIPLQAQNSSEVIGAMNSLITILERVLGFSPQEVGGSASHQQSATEMHVIAGNSSTRMNFTGGFVDDAIYARKKILWNGLIHYSDDDIFVSVADMTPEGKSALETMGFSVEPDGKDGVMKVKGSKKGLTFEGHFSERDGANRVTDMSIAQMLQTFLDRLMSNPRVGSELPLKYIFKFFNQVAETLGLPPELKLPEDVETQTKDEQMKQLQAMQAAISQIIEQQVGPPLEQLSQAVAQVAAKSQQADQEVEQALTQIAGQQQQQGQAIAQVAQAESETRQQVEANMAATQTLMATLDRIVQSAAAPVV